MRSSESPVPALRRPPRALVAGYDLGLLNVLGDLSRAGRVRSVLADRPGDALRRLENGDFDVVVVADRFSPRLRVGPLLQRLLRRVGKAHVVVVTDDPRAPEACRSRERCSLLRPSIDGDDVRGAVEAALAAA